MGKNAADCHKKRSRPKKGLFLGPKWETTFFVVIFFDADLLGGKLASKRTCWKAQGGKSAAELACPKWEMGTKIRSFLVPEWESCSLKNRTKPGARRFPMGQPIGKARFRGLVEAVVLARVCASSLKAARSGIPVYASSTALC